MRRGSRLRGEALQALRFGRLAVSVSVAVVGVGVVFTPISASAFSTAQVARLDPAFPAHPLVLKPGATVNAPTTTLTFTDNTSSPVWAAGDQITFQMSNGSGALGITSLTIPTVTASNGFTGFSVTPARSASSAFNDEFVLTFNQAAPLDTNATSFTFTGPATTLSPTDPGALQIDLRALASNGTPFSATPIKGTAAPTNVAYARYGYVAGIAVSVAMPTTAHAGQRDVVVGPIDLVGYYAGDIVSGDTVNLTLTGGTWSAAPSWSGSPSIGPISGVGTQTLSFTALADSTANSSLTLTGAAIDLPADTAAVSVSLTNGGESWNATPLTTTASTTRVVGADRYATAAALFDLPELLRTDVVLTSGVNFPDALSAAYLARQLPTGILTTDPDSLSAATRELIVRESVRNVYVIGGPASVSDAVIAQLQQINVYGAPVHVVRVSGADRYATNGAVDRYPGKTAPTVLIASGAGYADALAAGPISYRENYPLVLVPPSGLGDTQKATLTALGATSAIIVGGTKAVSSDVEQQLAAMGITVEQRLAGADRTQTAALIATWETDGIPAAAPYASLPSLQFMVDSVYLARGDGFADALAAGPIAGFFGTPILLTASPNSLGQGAASYLAGHHLDVSEIEAIGGTVAVSDSTLSAAVAALG